MTLYLLMNLGFAGGTAAADPESSALDLTGRYQTAVSVAGTYEPTWSGLATYQPTIDLVGEYEEE
jgi:hypothetical protein